MRALADHGGQRLDVQTVEQRRGRLRLGGGHRTSVTELSRLATGMHVGDGGEE
jgi:hypothetical protein